MVINPKLDEIALTALMAFDLETTGLEAWRDHIDLVALTNETGESYILEWDKYSKEELTDLFKTLSASLCIGQNIKFDCNFVYYHAGVLLTNVHCTQVTAQIIENGYQRLRDFDLISILKRYLNVTHANEATKAQFQKSFANAHLRAALSTLPQFRLKQFEYAVEDTTHLIPLYHIQLEHIEQDDLGKIYKLEHTLLPCLVKMECRGCTIDAKKWQELITDHWEPQLLRLEQLLDSEVKRLLGPLKTKFTTTRQKAKASQFDLFGGVHTSDVESEGAINYASSAQLLDLFPLFNEQVPLNALKMPSVDEVTLSVYVTENPESRLEPLIKLILEYREYAKLISTYGISFLEKLDKNSKIHTQYTQTQTETGRLSSKSPNLQNVPSVDKAKPETDIRSRFIARPGYVLITCDMAAAEVRIAADYSGDKLLIDSIEQGFDMHSKLGSVTYSIIFDEKTTIDKGTSPKVFGGRSYIPDDLRTIHKTGLFAKFYKAGANRMYAVFSEYINAHWPPESRKSIAKRISDALDKELPQLSEYLDRLIQKAQRTGKLIANKLGRIRYFNKDKVYGEAANLPIQGTNADAQKIAIINIDKYLSTLPGDAGLVLNVHDETVSEVLEESAEQAKEVIHKITSDALSYFLTRIKGDASVNVAKYWKK